MSITLHSTLKDSCAWELSASEFRLYIYICLEASQNQGICERSLKQMAHENKLSIQNIRTLLKNLIQKDMMQHVNQNLTRKLTRSKIQLMPIKTNGCTIHIKNANTKSNTIANTIKSNGNIPYEKLRESYNNAIKGATKLTTWNADRKERMRIRWKQHPGMEFWDKYFRKVGESDFLNGYNDRGWRANFDFVIRSDAIISKILEGYYTRHEVKSAIDTWLPPEMRECHA